MGVLDIIMILGYLIFMLWLGIYASKKQKNIEDFYLGGKNMGTLSMMSLWLSSWVGGAAIIGTAENAYKMGITGIWYVGSMCIGFAVFGTFFTGRIKELGNKFEHITYSDLIEDRYDSKTRVVSVVTTLLANIAYNAGQLVAAGGIMSMFTGLELHICIIISAIIVTLYTASGGLLAVTYTDLAQTGLIVISLIIAVPFVIKTVGMTGLTLIEQVPESFLNPMAWGLPTILGFVVTITLTFFTSMDSYTRCFAAKDAKTAKNGTLLAIIGTIIIAGISTYLGMAGYVMFPNMDNPSAIIMKIVTDILPTGVKGLMLIGLISALMSTSDISTLSASANITRDIYNRYINPEATEEKLLKLGTISSIFVGILSTILAIKMKSIVDILYIAFTINSAGLFLPTITMFFWGKGNSKSAFWSMSLSLITVLVWFFSNMAGLGGIFAIDPVWPGLMVSALVFFPMSMMTKKTPDDMVKADKYLIK